MNDIYKACDLPCTLLFADDTALVFTGDISSESINGSLARFYSWLCANKLTLNCEKTKFMVFSKKRMNRADPILNINNVEIERVASMKYLGVIIDESLNFGDHIHATASKLNHLHSVFHQNKSFITPNVGRKLIVALAIPRLQYCSSVFHRAAARNIVKLDVIYRRLIRTAFRLDYETTSTNEIYRISELLPLCLLRQVQTAALSFRCVTGICAGYLVGRIVLAEDELIRRRHPRGTAAPVEFYLQPPSRLDVCKQSYIYFGPRILNSIPRQIIEKASESRHPISYFTKSYKTYISRQFYMSHWCREYEINRTSYFITAITDPEIEA